MDQAAMRGEAAQDSQIVAPDPDPRIAAPPVVDDPDASAPSMFELWLQIVGALIVTALLLSR